MAHRSKRYRAGVEHVDRQRSYGVDEALDVLASFPPPKFDETVELAVRLGIDPKKSDQLVRGSVSLPRGIGKSKRVIVFAEGEKAEEALAAGAVEVGSAELAQKIQDGWTDFDVAIATPDMMRHVGKLGRILGPQGKMPSPKSGTVTMDVTTAVSEFAAGKIEFRTDSGANVHVPVGKRSFAREDLRENIEAFLEHLRGLRPPAAKGAFLMAATLTSSMSPGIKLEVR
jgi:large subunit ribosomal protein L1